MATPPPPPQDVRDGRLANYLEYCRRPMPDDKTIMQAISNQVNKAGVTAMAHIRPNVFLIDRASTQTLHEQRMNSTATKPPPSSKGKEDEGDDNVYGPIKLRSGLTLGQKKDSGDAEMVKPDLNVSPVQGQMRRELSTNVGEGHSGEEDVDYRHEGSGSPDDGDNLMVDPDSDESLVHGQEEGEISTNVGEGHSGGQDAEYRDEGSNGSDDSDTGTMAAGEVQELVGMAMDDEASDQERESVANDSRNPENYIEVSGWPSKIPIWEYLGQEYTQYIVELLEAEPIKQPKNCRTELKHWQLTGVGKLLHLFDTRYKGGILGDEQGLGKSLTAITAMVADFVANVGKPYRGFNLIVTTKSCAPQWIEEIKRHYGPEMGDKAFFLNDAKITADELLDGEYLFVVCTWQFVMSRYTMYQKNVDFFKLLATKGKKWVDENVSSVENVPLNVRHVNALFSHVYKELNFPIRHLILDEAQFAKNVTTKTYEAVRHLHYERVLLLSGTFLANRWHDIFGLVSLVPGHPFDNYKQFMKTFAHKEVNGYYSIPSVSKRNRLIKFLMSFTVSRPVSLMNLPSIARNYYDFTLTDDEEAEVAFWVERYLMLMARSGKQQVFHRASSSVHAEKKALLQAVIAQMSCASCYLRAPSKLPLPAHLNNQQVALKERFAAAKEAAGGKLTMKELLAMVVPSGMDEKQAVSLEVTEHFFNVSLEQVQGETAEVEGDVPEVISSNMQARDPEPPLKNLDAPDAIKEDPEHDERLDYKYFKPPEERKVWLARLNAMEDDKLLSSKVVCTLDLIAKLRANLRDERIIVFSRFLRFLDMLGEAIRRNSSANSALSDMVPLQFNGTLSSEQRSFSQKVFNEPTNERPIFITAGSGGAGLNLTGGSQIIQCEPWWNPNEELQAHSRAWRMGQTKSVTVYLIRGVNSLIDYIIGQCQDNKTATNTGIMAPLRRKDDEPAIIPRQYQGGVGEH